MNRSREGARFITSLVMNHLRPPLGVRQVEQTKVPEVGGGEAAPKAPGERSGEGLQHGLAVLGAVLAALDALDDLSADVPVGEVRIPLIVTTRSAPS